MNDPREILNRIQRRRRGAPDPVAPRTPAPAPVAPTASQAAPGPQAAPVRQNAPAPNASPVPRPAGGHALYSELMRSHDRMGTRHVKKE